MATYFAVASGNFNDTATWSTTPAGAPGSGPPIAGDIAMANSRTVTVNVSSTCLEVRNDTTGGATAGGSFTLANSVTLTANVFAGTAICVTFSGIAGNSANITGNCNGGTASTAHGANNASTGTLTITGNCTGGSGGSAHGAQNSSTGTLTITGNCNGGTASTAHGAQNSSTGTLTITGNATGGSGGFGANNNSTGTMTIVGTINASEFNSGVGGGNRSQVTLLTGPFISSTTFGVNPIGCLSWRWAASLNNNTYITVPTNNLLSTRNLVTPDNATNFPATSDVRSGTTFGIGGALTGTCAVPPAASVAVGVPVDATVGTAALTASDIRSAIGLASANLDTQLAAIPTDIRTELTPELTEITETHLIHGLKTGSPLNVTPTARTAGAISQTITGDGVTTTTVTR